LDHRIYELSLNIVDSDILHFVVSFSVIFEVRK
jgi:hypothetical protein